ncbi:hypothetical protein N665_1293s0002 [Sinapis alba]|nr:hypothetical protein N665_1293s0002 [Sinapis alba]
MTVGETTEIGIVVTEVEETEMMIERMKLIAEEKEFCLILIKFNEVMKEMECRGITQTEDMLEATKYVGTRKLLLLRYLEYMLHDRSTPQARCKLGNTYKQSSKDC